MKTISISKWVVAAAMIFAGSPAAFAQINLNLGTLAPGDKITVVFDAAVAAPFPANVISVTNSATLAAAGFTLNSDDPATALQNDPTVTTVYVPPQINCPPDIFTNAAGACVPTLAFAAAVNAGYPTPAVTYKLGATPISSPYLFPVATNTVTVTAANVAGTNSCNFTVAVANGPAPQLSIARNGASLVVSWPASYPCYLLQFATTVDSNTWAAYPGPFATNAGTIYVTNSAPFTNRFFRLLH